MTDEAHWRMVDILARRVFPAVWGLAWLIIATSGHRSLEWFIFDRGVGVGVTGAYGLLLLLLAWHPEQWAWLHRPGAALAVIVCLGRAASFVADAIGPPPRSDLWASATERGAVLVGMLLWHLAASAGELGEATNHDGHALDPRS